MTISCWRDCDKLHSLPAFLRRKGGGRLSTSSHPIPGTRQAGLEDQKGTKMSENAVYGGSSTESPATALTRKTRTHHLLQMKAEGERWGMLTAYDYSSARIFEEAGVPVLLVGDSAANVVYGYDTTVPITVDELLPLVRGVVRGAPHALVVADLPFGTYEASPQQALETAVRFMKEGLAGAVKLEGGERVAPQIAAITAAGIPVMAHVGFTPQSVNTLGGFRVQGRGDASEQLVADAIAVQEAGAFAVVMEMVPADIAGQVTRKLTIPTVGIGAGNECDAQVLVWQDMAGYTNGKTAKFVKKFADVGDSLRTAATTYMSEVRSGVFPGPEHSY